MNHDLNQNWYFQKEGGAGRSLDLPHDAVLEEKGSGACPSGVDCAYFPGGASLFSHKNPLLFTVRSRGFLSPS